MAEGAPRVQQAAAYEYACAPSSPSLSGAPQACALACGAALQGLSTKDKAFKGRASNFNSS